MMIHVVEYFINHIYEFSCGSASLRWNSNWLEELGGWPKKNVDNGVLFLEDATPSLNAFISSTRQSATNNSIDNFTQWYMPTLLFLHHIKELKYDLMDLMGTLV
jgi:hypothetical protein